jgi:hypothetical protein
VHQSAPISCCCSQSQPPVPLLSATQPHKRNKLEGPTHPKSVSLKSYGTLSPSVRNFRRSSRMLWKNARANSSFWYLTVGSRQAGRRRETVWLGEGQCIADIIYFSMHLVGVSCSATVRVQMVVPERARPTCCAARRLQAALVHSSIQALQVGAQPLWRLGRHLQTALQDADGEVCTWVGRQPQPKALMGPGSLQPLDELIQGGQPAEHQVAVGQEDPVPSSACLLECLLRNGCLRAQDHMPMQTCGYVCENGSVVRDKVAAGE